MYNRSTSSITFRDELNLCACTTIMQVDPVTISAGIFGSESDILVSFTQVPFNRSPCNTGEYVKMSTSDMYILCAYILIDNPWL